ncbi:histidine phosphatase family protein [Streptococcus oricebi]|uniref:Histidine phosphatase family protein n=1 Tax=Streptococcus oricebi TaxID=1547447 RepID=A0ABS5B5F0_9STRE|nr:histidine phosphatase family protein [Streptococcus oricebi]MBP2624030.1 histidine phosphatase family protein [Streptococcus oricebi]
MAKTRLYIVRHGKTMFNTIGRAQGWSDTPLTAEGEKGIHHLGIGLRQAGIEFKRAFSSDSGRTIQTMGILLDELGLRDQITYTYDKRIREWCFGSFDGSFDVDLFTGLLPRIFNVDHVHQLSYPELAEGLVEVDTANWAESWGVLSGRIVDGFTAMAKELEESGGGNALIVSHGMTIGTFMYLIDQRRPHGIQNGSVTVVEFENGQFKIEVVGDTSYREAGAKLVETND